MSSIVFGSGLWGEHDWGVGGSQPTNFNPIVIIVQELDSWDQVFDLVGGESIDFALDLTLIIDTQATIVETVSATVTIKTTNANLTVPAAGVVGLAVLFRVANNMGPGEVGHVSCTVNTGYGRTITRSITIVSELF